MNPKRPLLLAFSLLAAGCASTPEPFPIWKLWGLDVVQQADGSVQIPDTRRNWKLLDALFDGEAKCEADGLTPSAGMNSWPEFWHRSFSEIRANNEHPEKYFALILDIRRRYSLPDLPKAAIEP